MATTTKKAAKAVQEPGAKYKLTLSLDPELARRFASYCGLVGRDQSEVASEAMLAWLRREGFVVGFRKGKASVPPVGLAEPSDDHDATEPTDLRVAG